MRSMIEKRQRLSSAVRHSALSMSKPTGYRSRRCFFGWSPSVSGKPRIPCLRAKGRGSEPSVLHKTWASSHRPQISRRQVFVQVFLTSCNSYSFMKFAVQYDEALGRHSYRRRLLARDGHSRPHSGRVATYEATAGRGASAPFSNCRTGNNRRQALRVYGPGTSVQPDVACCNILRLSELCDLRDRPRDTRIISGQNLYILQRGMDHPISRKRVSVYRPCHFRSNEER